MWSVSPRIPFGSSLWDTNDPQVKHLSKLVALSSCSMWSVSPRIPFGSSLWDTNDPQRPSLGLALGLGQGRQLLGTKIHSESESRAQRFLRLEGAARRQIVWMRRILLLVAATPGGRSHPSRGIPVGNVIGNATGKVFWRTDSMSLALVRLPQAAIQFLVGDSEGTPGSRYRCHWHWRPIACSVLTNFPSLMSDSLERGLLPVEHSPGAHRISCSPWSKEPGFSPAGSGPAGEVPGLR